MACVKGEAGVQVVPVLGVYVNAQAVAAIINRMTSGVYDSTGSASLGRSG